MSGRRGVRTKKSAVSGVTITQFVDNIPRGCSIPDFERKPITLTLQEGKNAIFRAVVKGEPKPELLWQRSTGKIIDHDKYRITSVPGTNEFTLQISDITEDDADVYRFTAVNDYGEATCSAGLKIIQVGFKKKTKDVSVTAAPQTDLKKEITHFRKALKKTTPVAAPKKEIDMEQVWQLLLDADRKDYEKICMKYGIVDFRGMLRRLQEMKEEKEIKQAEYVHSIANLKHVRINEQQANASIDLEMELKNPQSRIYLYKDGEMINFGLDDDNIKHCLRQVGKKYNFVINDLQPEDAGLYQIKIEDVDIFSTELEAENIPVYFRFPLGDVRCHEEGNAVLQCTLYEPCFTALWLHKNNRLEPNDKYEISVSDDGLMHRLVIKNTLPSDKGTYTIDIGRRTSSAWLEVESAKGKRKQLEGDSDDKVGWRKKQLEEDRSKKLPEDQDHPADSNMGKAGQCGRGQKGSLGKDGKMGQFSGAEADLASDSSRQIGFHGKDGMMGGAGTGRPGSAGGADGLYGKGSVTGDSSGQGGAGGLGGLYSKDSMSDGAGGAGGIGGRYGKDGKLDSHGGSGGAGGLPAVYGKDGMQLGADGAGISGKDGMLGGIGGASVAGGLSGLYGKDGIPFGSGTGGPSGNEGAGSLYGKDGMLGSAGVAGLYGKDGMPVGAGFGGADGKDSIPGGAGGIGGKYGLSVGIGAGEANAFGRIGGPYGMDGILGGAGSTGGLGGLYNKDGMPGAAGLGGYGGPGGAGVLYGKDSIPGGHAGGLGELYGKDGTADNIDRSGGTGGKGGLYDKDGLPVGAGGVAGIYDKNGRYSGAGLGGAGDAGRTGGFYGKDGILGGTDGAGGAGGIGAAGVGRGGAFYGKGVGTDASGPGDGGAGNLYGKDGRLIGAGGPGALDGTGGPFGAGGVAGFYGEDGRPVGSGTFGSGDAVGAGGLYGKDGELGVGGAGRLHGKDVVIGGISGSGAAGHIGGLHGTDGVIGGGGPEGIGGLNGKDDILGGGSGAGGIAGLHGKDGMPSGAGSGEYGSGAGGLHGKSGVLGGTLEAAGVGGKGRLHGKDGMLAGAGTGGPHGIGGVGGFYGQDGMPVRVGTGGHGGAGGLDGLYGKDGMFGGAGTGGTGGVGGLYGQDGMPIGISTGGHGVAGELGGLYGKDGMPAGAGTGGPGDIGGVGGLYGKDGMPVGIGTGGLGGAGGKDGLYGKDGMPAGAGTSGPGGIGGVGGLYSQDSIPVGIGTGGHGGAGELGGLYGKDGMPAGAETGSHGGTVGVGGLYGQNGMPVGRGTGGLASAGGKGGLYGKDGMPVGAGTGGPGGFGGVGGFYGQDGMPVGTGTGGHGSAGGLGGLYAKDGMPSGTETGGHGGTGSVGVLYGQDGMPIGAGTAGHCSAGGEVGLYGKDGMLGGVGPHGAGGAHGLHGKAGNLGSAGGLGGAASVGPGGTGVKDGVLGGAGAAGSAGAGGVGGLCGKDGMPLEYGVSGEGVLYGKSGLPGGEGRSQPGGIADHGGLYGKDGRVDGTGAGGTGFSEAGGLGNIFGKEGRLGGIGVGIGAGGIDGSLHEKMSGTSGEESLAYGQSSGFYGAGSHPSDRRQKLSNVDASGLILADASRSRDRKGRILLEEDEREPHCRFTQGLFDLHAHKGKPAVLSCRLNDDQTEGTWFKDGNKITGLDGVSIEKEGPVHKLVIDDVQEKHAGKYKFEAEDIRTEASIFVEDPPSVDSALLNKMKEEPMVVKAGKSAMVKIPFEGRKPIRATWLKDDGELLDDARISTDCSDDYTRLTISTTNRKDCGDYKVKLKNESGTTEATLKLIVIDKPQPPTGPIEVVDCSTSGITIQWKPPKDDGGKPIKSYVIERQQVGRKTWLTLGEISGNTTVFTTNKVEHDKSYYFRVKAVNAEGTSEVLESDEVMAAAKVFPGPPARPKITSTSKGAISLSWEAPHKTGNSRIVGYTIEKCKKGSNSWAPVTDVPITGKKYTVTDLKEGLQYEFRVAAINTAGVGEASAPSEAAFAWDPMKPPGPVRDLKVVNTDYSSISLSWLKPESEEESLAKGYIVEMRHSDSLKWTQCNSVPLAMTTYIVRGLKAREMYFLRVRAINDGGWGEAVELDTCVQAVPPSVGPKVLGKDSIKSFMIVKAGNTLRIRIPFEASPPPEVFWQKDGKALPAKATTTTREGLSQLIIPRADFSDSGHYAIVLRTETGKKETFGFLVQVLDVPESPGPIQLVEKVPETVTLIWEPSPTEMRDRTLNYMVMRRDSYKGSWELVTDLIYTNKCTVANFVPGREYLFRVLAKNYMGVSEPSETVQPWSIHRERGKYEIKLPKYKGINHHHPPRFLVPLKPHVVILGFDCHMSCAVTGCPAPKVTWYKNGKNISKDPAFYSKNDFGICSLMIPGVTPADAGQYMVVAINELGEANSKAELTIKA